MFPVSLSEKLNSFLVDSVWSFSLSLIPIHFPLSNSSHIMYFLLRSTSDFMPIPSDMSCNDSVSNHSCPFLLFLHSSLHVMIVCASNTNSRAKTSPILTIFDDFTSPFNGKRHASSFHFFASLFQLSLLSLISSPLFGKGKVVQSRTNLDDLHSSSEKSVSWPRPFSLSFDTLTLPLTRRTHLPYPLPYRIHYRWPLRPWDEQIAAAVTRLRSSRYGNWWILLCFTDHSNVEMWPGYWDLRGYFDLRWISFIVRYSNHSNGGRNTESTRGTDTEGIECARK